jgi:hypothetical protein
MRISRYYNPNNFFGNAENVFERYQPESNMLCFHHTTRIKMDGFEKVAGADDNWRLAAQRMTQKAKG